MNPRRLYRSSTDRWIGGVAAGVADYFDVDPVIVRILWLILIPFTGGLAIIAYIVMLVVVPEGPEEWQQPSPWQPGGAPIGYSAPFTAAPGSTAQDAGTTPDGGGTASGAGSAADPSSGAAGGAAGGSAPAAAVPPTQGWDWRQDRWQRRADRWQRRAERREHRAERRNSGGLLLGAILIVVGGLAAWHQIDPALDLGLAWPVAIIGFGAFLVATSFEFGRGGK